MRAKFSFLLDGSFLQTAQRFRDAPGLGDAAARSERRLGVEDFADRADAGFSEMRLAWFKSRQPSATWSGPPRR
jgi:hypothetical protein